MNVAQLHALAAEAKTELRLGPGMPGMMYVEFGYVEGPDPEERIVNALSNYPSVQSCYMVNLHEIGHAHHGHTQGRPPKDDEKFYFDNGVLRSEAQAWEYALDHIDEELEDRTRHFMWYTCLGSYYSAARSANGRGGNRLWNGNRHHVAFSWDVPDDYFWGVVARIKPGLVPADPVGEGALWPPVVDTTTPSVGVASTGEEALASSEAS